MLDKSSMKQPILELKSIHFKYPTSTQYVLKDLNFKISSGDRIGIIGANGEGKTSFLHICVGLLKPQKGEIFFKGRKIKHNNDLTELRKTIGLVFQNADDQLFSPTVLEDVAFGPLNLGLSKDEAKRVALWALEQVGLVGFENRITNKLSGGEKKLLSLATIIAMKPKIMLLDEPTTGLAPATRQTIIDLLNRLPMDLIIVSHDWDFLDKTCREIY
jgi:cobalt/nickel transport system ATP-binding protein